MAGLKADADTRDGYKTAFDVQENSDGAVYIGSKWRSAKLNGKIWADKSVKVGEDGKTFDVTLSALGQTFANTTVTRDTVAFDVMFVVDRSTKVWDLILIRLETVGIILMILIIPEWQQQLMR